MNGVEIIAHRGAGKGFVQRDTPPENTLPAFEYAWSAEVQADAAEADIHLTRDGELVVIHDETTERTSDGRLRVADHTLSELRRLDAGSWKSSEFAGVRIPTIEEVIASLPHGRRLFVELKAGVDTLPRLTRVLAECGKTPSQLPLISFHFDAIVLAKRRLPEHECYFLADLVDRPRDLRELVSEVAGAGLDGIDVATGDATELVKRAGDRGLKLVVWTVNDLAAAHQMAEAGVRSITTDIPRQMRDALR